MDVDAACFMSIQCRFWQERSWDEGSVDIELPCGYLVFDVGLGTYACECSNGYTMRTEAMPALPNGQDFPGEPITDFIDQEDSPPVDERAPDQNQNEDSTG